jgi:hypothetical protein
MAKNWWYNCVQPKEGKGQGNNSLIDVFWLGYHALNAIACENGEPLERTFFVSELVKFEMVHDEGLEHLEAISFFPYILQEAWHSKEINEK